MKTVTRISTILAAIAVAVVFVPTCGRQSEAHAQPRHPYYLRALTDLRLAASYLRHDTPSERIDNEQDAAVTEIADAITEIKQAAIEDGKNINDRPPSDARIEPRDRFQKAKEALRAAINDVNQEEDDPHTKGLQGRAMNHIRRANQIIEDIQRRKHWL